VAQECAVRMGWVSTRSASRQNFDSNGLALMDEFSDAIAACITDGFEGGIDVVSISPAAD
jgi:hypothetical protein